ncbi:MAG: efflux RND transporter permease subunit [Thermoguttaceae bacterium]|nr:efflux RND transporter permease subunit [Thermoguttaceae bacterium]
MDLIRFSINNPVKIAVFIILILVFGVIALDQIPIQLTPDVDRPTITVFTQWSGRSPEEVEESIILEQEEKLKSIQGLWKMTSYARLGRSFIKLEFNVGTDKTRALQEVANSLDEVKSYPENVDRPVIRMQDSASDDAVVYMMLTAKDTSFEVAEIYDFADRYIKPPLERIVGVSEVDIRGGREHELHVRFNPYKLAQYEISPVELLNALRSDNVNESAGDMPGGRLDYRYRILGQYRSLEPILKTVIKRDKNGVPIYVEDVAIPELVLEKSIHFDQSKGQTSMSVFVKRETGSNVLDIVKQVKERIAEMNAPGGMLKRFHHDRYGLQLHITYEDANYINLAIANVLQSLYTGGFLAVLCLILFLRSPRPTAIIAVAIPLSVIGTFVVLWFCNRNLNVISLAGLSFAVGMVVDNAIVVLENTDRHLSEGEPLHKAAYNAVREVWGAVLSSTLTTIGVFAPILTIQEEAGQLFYDLALAICSSVGISLIVAFTIIPCACSLFMKPHKEVTGWKKWFSDFFGIVPFFGWICDKYADFIYMLTAKNFIGVWCRLVIVVTITVASVSLSVILIPPASYLPNGNKNFTSASLVVPPSYSLMQSYTVGQRLEDAIRPFWEAKSTEEVQKYLESKNMKIRDFQTGQVYEKVPNLKDFFFVVANNSVFMIGMSGDPENVKPVASIFSYAMREIPGATGMARQASIFGKTGGGSNAVTIEMFCDELEKLRPSASALQKRLRDIFSKFSVTSYPANFDEAGPEIHLNVNQVRAKDLGLSINDLAVASRAFIDGAYVGDFNYEGINIDLILIRDPRVKMDPAMFRDLPLSVVDEKGQRSIIPIGQVLDEELTDSTQQIMRIEQQRSISLTVSPPPTMALEEAERIISEEIEKAIEEGDIMPGVHYRYSGSSDRLTQVRTALMGKWTGWNLESVKSVFMSRFFIALLLTYLLMAALFEDFVYPFVIMFSVPLACVGGFIGLYFMHKIDPSQSLDVLTMLGFVILIGVVVNNAILLVYQALNYMRGFGESAEDRIEPLPPREAIRQSVRTRMRPIFMTTSTSLAGMWPLVAASSSGSELYRGLGSVVLGGLACATIFTLVVVPLLFSLVIDLKGAPKPIEFD